MFPKKTLSNRVLYIDICFVFPGRCTDPRALWEASLVQITAALPAYEFLLCPMPPLRKTPCAISIDISMVGISPSRLSNSCLARLSSQSQLISQSRRCASLYDTMGSALDICTSASQSSSSAASVDRANRTLDRAIRTWPALIAVALQGQSLKRQLSQHGYG